MAFLHRSPAVEPDIGSSKDTAVDAAPAAEQATGVPLTRAGAAWVSVAAAAFIAALLLIFLVQNPQQVQIHFLWMTTSTSLALTLLIAVVGAVLATVILGTARIVQLRKVIHGREPR